jgi:hypothetical protein
MLELPDGIGAISRFSEAHAVAGRHLVRADDERAGEAGRNRPCFQHRKTQCGGPRGFAWLGVLDDLRRGARELEPQACQQLAAIVRGGCQYELAALCHHFVLTSFFSDDIIRAPCRMRR